MAALSTTPKTVTAREGTPSEGLPEIPEYITNQFIKDYVAASSTDIQTRFSSMMARNGIDFDSLPMTEVARTVVKELFMEAI